MEGGNLAEEEGQAKEEEIKWEQAIWKRRGGDKGKENSYKRRESGIKRRKAP